MSLPNKFDILLPALIYFWASVFQLHAQEKVVTISGTITEFKNPNIPLQIRSFYRGYQNNLYEVYPDSSGQVTLSLVNPFNRDMTLIHEKFSAKILVEAGDSIQFQLDQNGFRS